MLKKSILTTFLVILLFVLFGCSPSLQNPVEVSVLYENDVATEGESLSLQCVVSPDKGNFQYEWKIEPLTETYYSEEEVKQMEELLKEYSSQFVPKTAVVESYGNSAKITAPAGKYKVIVTVKDEKGNIFTEDRVVVFVPIYADKLTDKILGGSKLPSNTTQRTRPDYGLYWFGYGNKSQKFVPGQPNPYFDPSKPTVIYVHGWEKDTGLRYFRETFNYKLNDPNYGINVNMADAWIKAGWNIGIFYWDMFSDEPNVLDAEAKIWSAKTSVKMRWRDHQGNFHDSGITKSAGELFVEEFVKAMSGYKGNNIRIVGHSLGNQMATYLSYRINTQVASGKLPSNLKIKRLALMDPYWSNGKKSYLNGKWTGEVCRQYVSYLISSGTVIELYRSSIIGLTPVADENVQLLRMVAFVNQTPWYIPGSDIGGKHVASPNLYFLSFGSPAPTLYTVSSGKIVKTTGVGPSAIVSDSTIKSYMSSSFRFDQYTGAYTANCNDDGFVKISRGSVQTIPVN